MRGGKIVNRSIIPKVAYRAGVRLFDAELGRYWDFRYRAPDVAHKELELPEEAQSFLQERETLWNCLQAAEKQYNAQLAREHELSLPVELNLEQQVALMRAWVRQEFISKGVGADWAIHHDNSKNPHAHVLTTLRRFAPEGFEPWEAISHEVRHASKYGFLDNRPLRKWRALNADFMMGESALRKELEPTSLMAALAIFKEGLGWCSHVPATQFTARSAVTPALTE